jgi:hypothetical protein
MLRSSGHTFRVVAAVVGAFALQSCNEHPLEYVVDQFVARYREMPDEAILGAFDSVTFDAGNGVQLCRFYRETIDVPAIIQHYHRPGSVRTNLKRCRVASGISREDYARLVP